MLTFIFLCSLARFFIIAEASNCLVRTCNDFGIENLQLPPPDIHLPSESEIGKARHWNGLKPDSYHLEFNFQNRTHHNASVQIKFHVLYPIERIFINQDSSDLIIDYETLYINRSCDQNLDTCISNATYIIAEQTLILAIKGQNLVPNVTYTLVYPSFYPTEERYQVRMRGLSGIRDWISEEENAASLTTVFQMRHARTAFPCFDHPSLKANFHLCVEHPDHLIAATNTIRDESKSTRISPNRSRDCFEPTPPLPTYIFAIALMENYSSIQRTADNFTLEIFAPARIVEKNYTRTLQLAKPVISAMTEITGFKFPLKRFGFIITSPGAFGGIEHMGLISLDIGLMASDWNLVLLIHEIVHQWIGNTFTIPDWRQMCLQEGLTMYMEWALYNYVFQRPLDVWVRHHKRWLKLEYPSYASTDLDDVASACFRQAPHFFHPIIKTFGFGVMKDFLRKIIENRIFGTASIDDWDDIMSNVTNGSLRGYIKDWFSSPGPLFLLISENKASQAITVHQRLYQNGTLISTSRVLPIILLLDNVTSGVSLKASTVVLRTGSIDTYALDPDGDSLAVKIYPISRYLYFWRNREYLHNASLLLKSQLEDILQDFCHGLIRNVLPSESMDAFNASDWTELRRVLTENPNVIRQRNCYCCMKIESELDSDHCLDIWNTTCRHLKINRLGH